MEPDQVAQAMPDYPAQGPSASTEPFGQAVELAGQDPSQLVRLPAVPPASAPESFPPPCEDPVASPSDPCQETLAPAKKCGCEGFEFTGLARGYYLNDQRIEWSGQEATFGAEAALNPTFRRRLGEWETVAEGEFYLNVPFDDNILVDTPQRRSYLANFEVDTLEISKLNLAFSRNDWLLKVGKFETPFGRTYFPLFSNARLDAPFIRTEAIRWRELGALVEYSPGCLVATAALTNGCDDMDTNSSKALVARLGLEGECWAFGASVKQQDGTGSDGQKQYNNHIGVDAMVRWSNFTLSSEAIYDEYGFRVPGFDPDDMTWERSIYYRDQNKAPYEPITGVGYYVDLTYHGPQWTVSLNYGEYYPEELGDPQHDVTNRRGIVKTAYAFSPWLQTYLVGMQETDGFVAQEGRPRRGTVLLTGFQYQF